MLASIRVFSLFTIGVVLFAGCDVSSPATTVSGASSSTATIFSPRTPQPRATTVIVLPVYPSIPSPMPFIVPELSREHMPTSSVLAAGPIGQNRAGSPSPATTDAAASTATPMFTVIPAHNSTSTAGIVTLAASDKVAITPTTIPSFITLRPPLAVTPIPTRLVFLSPTPAYNLPPGAYSWEMASLRVGQKSTLCGPVIDTRYADNSRGKPTFLNIGRGYPDQARLTIVIWGENRRVFSPPPEIQFATKRVCVTGQISQYQGVSEIEVSAPSQISLW